MVLEAFAALSLASSIVQFVDFASKVVAQSSKIYKSKSGAAEEVLNLQVVNQNLEELVKGLQVDFEPSSPVDEGISELARLCTAEASKFSDVLSRLAGDPDKGKLQSLKQAFATIWKKERIDECRKNLGLIQTQLILHLSIITWYANITPCHGLTFC
jgi:NACHT NTPase-like protein